MITGTGNKLSTLSEKTLWEFMKGVLKLVENENGH